MDIGPQASVEAILTMELKKDGVKAVWKVPYSLFTLLVLIRDLSFLSMLKNLVVCLDEWKR